MPKCINLKQSLIKDLELEIPLMLILDLEAIIELLN